MKEVILEDTVAYLLKHHAKQAAKLFEAYEPKETKNEIKYLIKK